MRTHLRRLYVLVLVDDWNIVKWLTERDVLIFVVKFLFVVVRSAKSFPRQSIDEQGMFLEIFFKCIFL